MLNTLESGIVTCTSQRLWRTGKYGLSRRYVVALQQWDGKVMLMRHRQLVNFRFMPLPYRVPFQSTCGVFWTLYLSLLNAKYVTPHLSEHLPGC